MPMIGIFGSESARAALYKHRLLVARAAKQPKSMPTTVAVLAHHVFIALSTILQSHTPRQLLDPSMSVLSLPVSQCLCALGDCIGTIPYCRRSRWPSSSASFPAAWLSECLRRRTAQVQSLPYSQVAVIQRASRRNKYRDIL